MLTNNGKGSEKDFVDILTNKYGKSVYIHRFMDTGAIKGARGSGFVANSPADYLVTLHGKMFYAEVKSTFDKVSFAYSRLQKNQRGSMICQTIAGGDYYVYVYSMIHQKWYKLDGKNIIKDMDNNIKSIKFCDMKEEHF